MTMDYKTECEVQIEMTQKDMQNAMAHWLSTVVLKDPVEVTTVDGVSGPGVTRFRLTMKRLAETDDG